MLARLKGFRRRFPACCLAAAISAAAAAPASGTEKVLHAYQGGNDGWLPQSGVVADSAGNLYGTTSAGGAGGFGTVFKVTAHGAESALYSFQEGAGGVDPAAGVILDKLGNLYGTTYYGESTDCKGDGCGAVFELAPDGTETVLLAFDKRGFGRYPSAGLLLGKHGDLYGTTLNGGRDNNGVVFELKK